MHDFRSHKHDAEQFQLVPLLSAAFFLKNLKASFSASRHCERTAHCRCRVRDMPRRLGILQFRCFALCSGSPERRRCVPGETGLRILARASSALVLVMPERRRVPDGGVEHCGVVIVCCAGRIDALQHADILMYESMHVRYDGLTTRAKISSAKPWKHA
jgi:hypothetical protein